MLKAVVLKAVDFNAVGLKAVVLKAVGLRAVLLKAVDLQAMQAVPCAAQTAAMSTTVILLAVDEH